MLLFDGSVGLCQDGLLSFWLFSIDCQTAWLASFALFLLACICLYALASEE